MNAAALDELHVFVASRLIGGAMATRAVGGNGVLHMAEALKVAEWTHEILEGDLYVHGWR